MRKEEFYVLNSLYNGSIGRAGCTYDDDSRRETRIQIFKIETREIYAETY